MSQLPSISVIICTRDRAESLRITLECPERATFCLLSLVRWRLQLATTRRLVATERAATYRELLRLAGVFERYALSNRWPVLRLWR
jgi:hypothetical protein